MGGYPSGTRPQYPRSLQALAQQWASPLSMRSLLAMGYHRWATPVSSTPGRQAGLTRRPNAASSIWDRTPLHPASRLTLLPGQTLLPD